MHRRGVGVGNEAAAAPSFVHATGANGDGLFQNSKMRGSCGLATPHSGSMRRGDVLGDSEQLRLGSLDLPGWRPVTTPLFTFALGYTGTNEMFPTIKTLLLETFHSRVDV
jgi:hypothetical protein